MHQIVECVPNFSEGRNPETIEAIEWLDDHQVVASRTVFANRVLPRLETEAPGSGPAADAASLHRSLTAEQAIWLDRLPTHLDLPFLFGAESAPVVADRLGEAMGALIS